jgi:hypothetical protein
LVISIDAKLAGAVETFAGGKVETLHGLLIANNPGEMWKKQMSIEDVKTVAKKSAQVAILCSALIMHG